MVTTGIKGMKSCSCFNANFNLLEGLAVSRSVGSGVLGADRTLDQNLLAGLCGIETKPYTLHAKVYTPSENKYTSSRGNTHKYDILFCKL